MIPLINHQRDEIFDARILSYTYDEYVRLVREFHGSEAPGVVIGGFMVDMAVRNLPEGVLYDAISETRFCLPDAIQLLTPCTIGNGWLKIFHNGRFALTLYDKQDRKGVRVFVDPGKIKSWPEIEAWYLKRKAKKEQNKEDVACEIKEAAHSILSTQRVRVKSQIVEKRRKGNIAVCPTCHEAYPIEDGEVCLSCQGNALYVKPKFIIPP